jgi:hypothetical protein
VASVDHLGRVACPKLAIAFWACHQKELRCRKANVGPETPVKEDKNADTDYLVTAVVRRGILWV